VNVRVVVKNVMIVCSLYKHLPSGKLVIVLNNDVTKATRSVNYRNLVVDAKDNKYLVNVKDLILAEEE